MSDSSTASRQGASERSGGRRWAWRIGSVLVVAAIALLILRWATEMRQSGVRLKPRLALMSVVQAVGVYQQQYGTPPSLDDLLAARMLDKARLREFSRCESTPQAGDVVVLDAWLVQTVPCRAVRRGEAWGGPGETIDHDLPACRFVLMKDWSVRQIDEPDFQRDCVRSVRLVPYE